MNDSPNQRVVDIIQARDLSRRGLLRSVGMGIGSLGLTALLGSESAAATSPSTSDPLSGPMTNPLAVRQPHFPAKAKRVIHIFCNGGPSHVDTFDPKPKLDEYHGKELPFRNPSTERKTGAAYRSPFKFRQNGESGIPVSELFPRVGECVDSMTVIRSMKADVPNHEPSLLLMNCGEARVPRPSLGSWVTYGLGSGNQNLPGFIAMCPGGLPIQGTQNWQCSFLPGIFQGTHIDTKHKEIEKLIEHVRNRHTTRALQKEQLELLRSLNNEYVERTQNDAQVEARIQSFELAFRMQMDAEDAFDISREPKYIRELYGEGVHARQTLIARRLLERGVRFVQLWHGQGQPWDSHDDLESNHRRLCSQSDQPIAALLTDLKQRGMLDDTLVIWGGEFGRTPTVELPKAGSNAGKVNGRDHNHHGFTMWMAGGGVKGGHIHGSTDEFGFAATENPVHVHDLHATILHLLGFDHERLTYRHAGRDFRLTDVHGKVVQEIIA